MFKTLENLWKKLTRRHVVPKEETFSMDIEELKENAEFMHPVGYYALACNLYNEGEMDESILWFYVGAIRYRYLLSSLGDDPSHPEHELFKMLQLEIGVPIIDHAEVNISLWANQIDKANQWDSEHKNFFYSKKKNKEELKQIKEKMNKFRLELMKEQEDLIREYIENQHIFKLKQMEELEEDDILSRPLEFHHEVMVQRAMHATL